METARVHLFIQGRVQGVFYRTFTRNIAVRLGLKGWVRNLYDGRVEAVFEGDRGLISQAILDCRKGPSGSHVTDIDESWSASTGDSNGFEIRY